MGAGSSRGLPLYLSRLITKFALNHNFQCFTRHPCSAAGREREGQEGRGEGGAEAALIYGCLLSTRSFSLLPVDKPTLRVLAKMLSGNAECKGESEACGTLHVEERG